MTKQIKWACPKCGAPAHGHGKGNCIDRNGKDEGCEGLICECDVDVEEHGLSVEWPCYEANCYHCGWGGMFPPQAVDPSKLTGWAKTAWSEGWRPPIGWTAKKAAKR